MSLEKWQKSVINSVINGIPFGDASHPDRVSIYHHGFYLRLYNALKNDFPVLYQCIGEKEFSTLVISYLFEYPPQHFSIVQIGKYLVEFMRKHNYKDYLYELATLEWFLSKSINALDVNKLTIDDLSAYSPTDWPVVNFIFHPSVYFIQCNNNITALYSDPKSGVSHWRNTVIVWRHQDKAYFQSLTDQQAKLFELIGLGKNFGEICQAVESNLFSVHDLINMLSYWIAQSIFIKAG